MRTPRAGEPTAPPRVTTEDGLHLHTAQLERMARTGEVRRALTLLEQNASPALFGAAMMLFGMHARAEHAEVLFRGAVGVGYKRDSIVWSAFVCALTLTIPGEPARGLDVLAEMRSLGITPQIAAVRAVSDRLVELGHLDRAMRLLRSASEDLGIDPATPHLRAAILRANLALSTSSTLSSVQRDAALASAADTCIDLAQRGVLPSVNDADAVFLAMCERHKPRDEVMAWVAQLHRAGADCSGGAWVAALDHLSEGDSLAFAASLVANAPVATGAADALVEQLIDFPQKAAEFTAQLGAEDREHVLLAVARRAAVLKLSTSWAVLREMLGSVESWTAPSSNDALAQVFVVAISAGEYVMMNKLLKGPFKDVLTGAPLCVVLRALGVAAAQQNDIESISYLVDSVDVFAPVPSELLAHASEWFASHLAYDQAYSVLVKAQRVRVPLRQIDWSSIVSSLACRGIDVRPILKRAKSTGAPYPTEVQMHGLERFPGPALEGYVRLCADNLATPRTHYWAMMAAAGCSQGYGMVRAIADRLVASGERLTAMHYDKLLSAALWSQSTDAILSTLNAMRTEKISVTPILSNQVRAFTYDVRTSNSVAIRRALTSLTEAEFTVPPTFAPVSQPPPPVRPIFDWPVAERPVTSKRRGNQVSTRNAKASSSEASSSSSSSSSASSSSSSSPKKKAR
jgi:hypothetical protein